MRGFGRSVVLLMIPAGLFAAKLQAQIFPPSAKLVLVGASGEREIENNRAVTVEPGSYVLRVTADEHFSKSIPVEVENKKVYIEDKLERKYEGLKLIKEFKVAGHPKSVVFLDQHRFEVNLLDGKGIELFTLSNTNRIGFYSPPEPYSKAEGFVEGLVDEEQNELFVSQMTKNAWHVFSLNPFEYKYSLSAHGNWTKVLAKSTNYIFVANWVSRNVSVFDRFSKKFVKSLKMMGTPRGLVVTPDQKYLYVAIFDDSVLQKVDLSSLKIIKTIRMAPRGAARHIVLDERRHLMYVADMMLARVFKIDYSTDEILGDVAVYKIPNTIVLSPDRRTLFVSCRGPNGPEGYMEKGNVYGKIYIVEVDTMKVLGWIWGRNQPTALDISPDGKILVIGDFLDNNIELYQVFAGLKRGYYGD